MQSENIFYPFCQFTDQSLLTMGAHSWYKRWDIINSFLDQPASFENKQLYPTLQLLTHVQQHKTLPHPLDEYCLVVNNATDFLKIHNELLSFDVATNDASAVSENERYRNTEKIFVENNVQLEYCFLDASNGPIYLAEGVVIQDNVSIKGPVYIGKNTIVKMGATIYGTTLIGTQCVVAGEIKNSIIMSYSNKAHYGYLGDSIVGEWCNLGAGTTNSNVKNNAGEISVSINGKNKTVGQKFGCLIGDFTKTAINTSINTGSVFGACCNVFAQGFPPKVLPNFSWGCMGDRYKLDELLNDIEKWMRFKNFQPEEKLKNQIINLYNTTV